MLHWLKFWVMQKFKLWMSMHFNADIQVYKSSQYRIQRPSNETNKCQVQTKKQKSPHITDMWDYCLKDITTKISSHGLKRKTGTYLEERLTGSYWVNELYQAQDTSWEEDSRELGEDCGTKEGRSIAYVCLFQVFLRVCLQLLLKIQH